MDDRLAAACPHMAYVDEAASAIEAVLVKAARRLVDEHEGEGMSAAAIRELEQALRDLRGFERAAEVELG
jgi:hypothetical protein